MILLDTNVLSELMLDRPSPAVVQWMDAQPRDSLWTTSVTVFELHFGLELMPEGKRRTQRRAALEKVMAFFIERRLLAFDHHAAEHTARRMAAQRRHGHPADLRDAMIAGIVLANQATLATRNVRHFDDIARRLVNPWTA
jgi:toxin FitB